MVGTHIPWEARKGSAAAGTAAAVLSGQPTACRCIQGAAAARPQQKYIVLVTFSMSMKNSVQGQAAVHACVCRCPAAPVAAAATAAAAAAGGARAGLGHAYYGIMTGRGFINRTKGCQKKKNYHKTNTILKIFPILPMVCVGLPSTH